MIEVAVTYVQQVGHDLRKLLGCHLGCPFDRREDDRGGCANEAVDLADCIVDDTLDVGDNRVENCGSGIRRCDRLCKVKEIAVSSRCTWN